jgi:hypothetical protein
MRGRQLAIFAQLKFISTTEDEQFGFQQFFSQ